jgi:hypothetical protein
MCADATEPAAVRRRARLTAPTGMAGIRKRRKPVVGLWRNLCVRSMILSLGSVKPTKSKVGSCMPGRWGRYTKLLCAMHKGMIEKKAIEGRINDDTTSGP